MKNVIEIRNDETMEEWSCRVPIHLVGGVSEETIIAKARAMAVEDQWAYQIRCDRRGEESNLWDIEDHIEDFLPAAIQQLCSNWLELYEVLDDEEFDYDYPAYLLEDDPYLLDDYFADDADKTDTETREGVLAEFWNDLETEFNEQKEQAYLILLERNNEAIAAEYPHYAETLQDHFNTFLLT